MNFCEKCGTVYPVVLLTIWHTGTRSLRELFVENFWHPQRLDVKGDAGVVPQKISMDYLPEEGRVCEWHHYVLKLFRRHYPSTFERSGILFYGHVEEQYQKHYERLRDIGLTIVTTKRDEKELRESWERRYGDMDAVTKAYDVVNKAKEVVPISLNEQLEYWKREVEPHATVVDLKDPQPALDSLKLSGELGRAGKWLNPDDPINQFIAKAGRPDKEATKMQRFIYSPDVTVVRGVK